MSPIGTAADFQIFHEQFWGGVVEVLQQNANGFNAASQNTLRLVTEHHLGEYREESFIQDFGASLVTRRDTTSTSAATSVKLTQEIERAVKLNRKLGPVEQTLDAWRKIGADPATLSFAVGKASAPAIALDMLNTLIGCLVTSIGTQDPGLVYDYSATGTMVHKALNSGLALFGDAADRLVCWVMHSKVYFELVGQAITDNVYNIGGMAIVSGSTPTLGRPVVITDSTQLITTGTPDVYHTLGLVANAGAVMESEDRTLVSEVVTGLEQLYGRIQGEFAYSILQKGFQWDRTNGGANPTLANLTTGTNWDKVAADDKSLPGVRIDTQ